MNRLPAATPGSNHLADSLRAYITARLDGYPPLLLHLVSAHCNGAALSLSETEAQDAHAHEHTGPGTIRDHADDDLSYDPDQVATVLLESAEMDLPGDEEDSPVAWLASINRLLRTPETTAPEAS